MSDRSARSPRPVRPFVALSVGLGTLTAVAVLLQAWLPAALVSTSFIERVGPADLVVPLAALLGVVLVRAVPDAGTQAGLISSRVDDASPGRPHEAGNRAGARTEHAREAKREGV